jgi:hypothetical protein
MASWLDTLLDRGNEAKREAAPQPVAPLAPREPKAEIKFVWFQTCAPSGDDLGACEAAHYSVTDGLLTMRDADGKPTGKKYPLRLGEDERVTAARLARQELDKHKSDFDRPLLYAQGGWR